MTAKAAVTGGLSGNRRQAFLDYIQENRHLLKGRPQVFQHGDYHIGNMMIDRDGKLLALYIAGNALSSVYWAIPFGQDEVNTMLDQAKDVLSWYDNMRNPVPSWYFSGSYIR